MSDDHERIAKGQRASRELEMTSEAFAKVRAAILNELAATSPSNPDKILKLHMAAQNLDAVKSALLGVAQDGQIAEHAIAASGLTRN